MRHRVVAIGLIDEEAPRLPRPPRPLDHLLPHHVGGELTDHHAGPGILQLIARSSLDRRHERVGDRDRDIEVRDLGDVFLARDELEDVRVIDPQDPHVRAATRAALLHRVSRGVVELHERHRPRRHSGRRPHHRALGADPRKRESRPPAALMDDRHRLERVVDAVLPVRQRIGNRQHEARRQLPQRPPRVHQGRGVWLEPPLRHQTVKVFAHRLDRAVARPIPPIRVRHGSRHPPKHFLRLLDRLPSLVFDQVSLLEHRASVRRQIRGASGWRGGQGHDDAPTRDGTGPTRNLAEPALKTPRLLTRLRAYHHASDNRLLDADGHSSRPRVSAPVVR